MVRDSLGTGYNFIHMIGMSRKILKHYELWPLLDFMWARDTRYVAYNDQLKKMGIKMQLN